MKWKLGVELENHLKRNGNQHSKAPLSNKAHKWILFVYLLSPNSYKIELEPRDRDSKLCGEREWKLPKDSIYISKEQSAKVHNIYDFHV